MSWINRAKQGSAEAAATHVRSGTVIGLGSGSTTRHFIQILGALLRTRELTDITAVPTSHQAAADARKAGIPLCSLDDHPEIELTIDGADQIDPGLDAIKGGGGALLREKIVAHNSENYILIADERKRTQKLGAGTPIPLEVLPFSAATVAREITELGASAILREGDGKLGPVVTDNGNFILDADFGPIEDPGRLDVQLRAIPGILETGLFLGLADFAYIGTRGGVERMERPR
ncbi:MAG: ribose-5-phosphate isomerase RpiA [Candidatus Bathyarchaeota archaeon]|jgi:ribose 5-phosphate isomerase A